MNGASSTPRRLADTAIAEMALALVGDTVLKVGNGGAGGQSLSDWFFLPIVIVGGGLSTP